MPSPDRVQQEYERVFRILRTTPFRKWFDFRSDLNQVLPLNPGHYAIRTEEEILYIGKASNLRTRINYSHPAFRRLWLDQIPPEQVRLMWVQTSARYIDYLLWIEKRMIFTLRPRYNVEIPKSFDEVTAMQQLQPLSGQIKDVLKYMPAHILNAIEDYADATGLPDEKVVELAFSMFLDLDATSFEELKTSKSPSLVLQENQVLSYENAKLRQELEVLKARLSESEPSD